jgi:hypothetical protein
MRDGGPARGKRKENVMNTDLTGVAGCYTLASGFKGLNHPSGNFCINDPGPASPSLVFQDSGSNWNGVLVNKGTLDGHFDDGGDMGQTHHFFITRVPGGISCDLRALGNPDGGGGSWGGNDNPTRHHHHHHRQRQGSQEHQARA